MWLIALKRYYFQETDSWRDAFVYAWLLAPGPIFKGYLKQGSEMDLGLHVTDCRCI